MANHFEASPESFAPPCAPLAVKNPALALLSEVRRLIARAGGSEAIWQGTLELLVNSIADGGHFALGSSVESLRWVASVISGAWDLRSDGALADLLATPLARGTGGQHRLGSHPPPRGESYQVLVVPLFVGRRALGVLTLYRRGEGATAFSPDDEALATEVASRVALEYDRARLDDRLGENRERLQLAIESANLGVWDYAPLTGKITWSVRCKALFGLAPEDPVDYATYLTFVHPEDRERTHRAVQAAMSGNGDGKLAVEYRICRPGVVPERWVAAWGRAVSDGAGTAVRLIGTIQDISEQKSAQAELFHQSRLLNLVIESMGDGLLVADDTGVFSLVNPAAEAMLGIKPGDRMEADSAVRFGLFLPDGVTPYPLAELPLRRSLRGEACDGVEILVRKPTPTGVEERWLLCCGRPIRGNANEVRGGVLVFSNITLRKSTEARLKAALKERERSNRELEQFAHLVSHDLKEPLRMITSYVSLLSQRYQGRLDAEAAEFIRFAVDGTHRMRQLIDDLLAYSQSGCTVRPFVKVDLNQVVAGAKDNLQIAIEESQAEIQVTPLPVVVGDFTLLTQLFQNLIGNAIKYRSQARPLIKVAHERVPEGWKFRIEDNGIGFEPRFRERIFDIFKRLHPRHKYPGSGVGLALSKKIVEIHGGEIGADSVPGVGSTFWFTLPQRGK